MLLSLPRWSQCEPIPINFKSPTKHSLKIKCSTDSYGTHTIVAWTILLVWWLNRGFCCVFYQEDYLLVWGTQVTIPFFSSQLIQSLLAILFSYQLLVSCQSKPCCFRCHSAFISALKTYCNPQQRLQLLNYRHMDISAQTPLSEFTFHDVIKLLSSSLAPID